MDILVKSFNRAYYLDRCLFSIVKHVKNFDGKIVVLDDGTPKIFLDRILSKYPNIYIEKSDFYQEKQKYATDEKHLIEHKIPIDLWVKAAKVASEKFLLIEDDTWFIEDVDFKELNQEIVENNVVLTKLYWVGNSKINKNKEAILKKNIVIITPSLYTIIPAFYYFIFYKFNRFKIRKLLRFFKINTDEKRLAYYAIYATAGVVFDKKYFINLWKNHQNKVDEDLQIYNAVKEYFKHKNKFAHYKKEVLRTGFISSATNQYKENYKGNVDMFIFNKLLNDAWLNNELDSISSLPKDISNDDVIAVLQKNDKFSTQDWIFWVDDFKNQYKSIGCLID